MQIFAMMQSTLAAYLDATLNASMEERTAAYDRFGNTQTPDIFAISDDGTEAAITITGVLTQDGPSPIARFFGFGGTGYKDIIAAAELIGDDARIKTIKLRMNTPGGNVDGMDQAREAIRALAKNKTVIAENHGLIASAGYYLATATNRIVSMSPLAQTGSIGVVIGGIDSSKAMEDAGYKRVKIISRNAPDKQPDPTSKHGEAVLQAEADAMERVFLQKVAEGRGKTVEDVIANFGRGGVLIAQDPDPLMPDALKSGMIDEIIIGKEIVAEYGNIQAANKENGISAIGGGNPVTAEKSAQKKESKMDLKQLKQEHPAVFAEAVSAGVTQERDRVQAHITMGTASGDMEYAVACINDGLDITATVQAKHFAAGMNRKDASARADEGAAAAAATASAGTAKAEDAMSEEALRIIENAMGVTHE